MKRFAMVSVVLLAAVVGYATAAETPKSLVQSYDSLADVILGAKKTEHNLVAAILEAHWWHAKGAADAKKWDDCAAEMAGRLGYLPLALRLAASAVTPTLDPAPSSVK